MAITLAGLLSEDQSMGLRKDKNNIANARCSVSNKTLALSTAGQSASTDHAMVENIQRQLKKYKTF